jgi:hypothetical protein
MAPWLRWSFQLTRAPGFGSGGSAAWAMIDHISSGKSLILGAGQGLQKVVERVHDEVNN